jgi:hypothetical protein
METAMREEDVYGRLRAVYRRLLDIPYNRIFVAQYPLSYPALPFYSVTRPFVNNFDPWVLEALAGRMNQEIARAVGDEAALARSQGKGDRLFLVSPERFNLGTRGVQQILHPGSGITCPSETSFSNVDGYSRQSAATQSVVHVCSANTASSYWFESLDGGIHLSKIGAGKFADELDEAVKLHGIHIPG